MFNTIEKKLSGRFNVLNDRLLCSQWGFDDSEDSGSGDALSQILGALPSLTNAGIAAFATSQGQTTFAPTRSTSPIYNNTSAFAPSATKNTWIWIAVLAVIGLVAYREL